MPVDFKQAILNAIHACADASNDTYIKLGLGTPGGKVDVFNVTEDTGQAFVPTPSALDCIVEGIAAVFTDLDLSKVVERSTLLNDSGTVIEAGSIVRLSGNDRFRLASTGAGAAVGLLGIVDEDTGPGQIGPVAIEGINDVRVETGLITAPVYADLLYLSTQAGRLTTTPFGAPLGIVLNASAYASQQKVRAVLRIPAQ